MTRKSGSYSITRIRLLNWHNFVDETIDVAAGGHLFLLGDNGSGKTTILDAIHYVLTAGENMEFNSAARVAGARSEGRRPQGVVMRYNVETGPLNGAGGITYAALEIAGRNGVLSTYAVGLETYAMNEPIRRWGIIRECPLEEIPLSIERAGQCYVASRQDIRDHFKSSSGYYANIEAYKRELASRLFNNENAFSEIARLLSMGKAYRELVSQSADYHELFKRLLPEPQPDIFERIITALNSLDQSAEDLRHLEDQLGYLNELQRQVDSITELREVAVRLQWVKARLELAINQGSLQRNHEQTAERDQRRTAAVRELAEFTAELQAVERQIADLQAKDALGLVRQEQESSADAERLQTVGADAHHAAKQAAAALVASQRKLAKLRESLADALRAFLHEISRLGPKLAFSLAEFSSGIDQAFRDAAPETRLDELGIAGVIEHLQAEAQRTATELGQLTEQRKQAARRVDQQQKALADLHAQVEMTPDLPGYSDALAALRRGMFSVLPLYEGLEWQGNLSEAEKSAIEETIGPEILATFVVQGDDDQLAAASQCLFEVGPGLRIAAELDSDDIPSWIRAAFDLARSDTGAIRCLAAEMISRNGPEVNRVGQFRALSFRGHRRRLAEQPACCIGAAARRAARDRRLRELEQLLKQANAELRGIEAAEKQLTGTGEVLAETLRKVTSTDRQLRQFAADIRTADSACEHRQASANDAEQRAEAAASTYKACVERLELLRARLRSEGLDNLDKLLKAAMRKKAKQQDGAATINRQLGEIDNQIKGLHDQQERLRQEGEAILERIQQQAIALRERRPDLDDIDHYILDTHNGRQFSSLDQVGQALGQSTAAEVAATTAIELGIRDQRFGALFGFAYDRQNNELVERRQRRIADVVTALAKQVGEQRELINEETRALFRKLVMGELLTHLREKVDVLRKMVRDINAELAKRTFGSNRYAFKLQAVERYEQLVRLVASYNPWKAEEGEAELRQFFEDQREAITSTEVGSIPELLDYRNWFRYDMRLGAIDGEGVLIDRYTKAIGSGGEQAVPNYLLILTVAHFMFHGNNVLLRTLLFDEAFYGIDTGRRDQILGFASDLDLQLCIASPDQDGVRQEVPNSTTLLVVKDEAHDVHLYPFTWENPRFQHQELLPVATTEAAIAFGAEL